MSETTTLALPPSIPDVLDSAPRRSIRSLRAEVRRIRRWLRQQAAKYGTLPAEVESRRLLIATTRARVRSLWMSRKGRRIELTMLLRQRHQDGRPVWAIVDPAHKPGEYIAAAHCRNGEYGPATKSGYSGPHPAGFSIPGTYCLGRAHTGCRTMTTHVVPVDLPGVGTVSPAAIPPLPAQARAIAASPQVRRRAKLVCLLYQPDEWMAARPDPAIVVEWHDRPGEYYALCVWGDDAARIREFCD